MRTILMISLAAMMAAPAAGWAQTAPDWTVRDWNDRPQSDPASTDPGWREPAWETRAREQGAIIEPAWDDRGPSADDASRSNADDGYRRAPAREDRDRSGYDRFDRAWDERDHSERAAGEGGRRDFGWTDGEAAPILTSPIRADEIPPAPEAPPDPDEATAPPDESSSESTWDEPKEARAAAAEGAAKPASDTTPWDEQTAPVPTGPRDGASDEPPSHDHPMSRWGELEPPRAEPNAAPDAGREPAPTGY